MSREYFWYSELAHKHLQQPSWHQNFSVGGPCVLVETGYVQVLPDGKLATFARKVEEGMDISNYKWQDVVYVGEYDRSEVRSVPADTV